MGAARGRISVIVPMFNASRYVAETLESILGQTTPPDEVVVVDDGSTDDSRAVVDASFPSITVLSQSNRGVSTARNAGVAASSGELVAFCDADDRWEPGKLGRQLTAMEGPDAPDAVLTFATEFLSPELEDLPSGVRQPVGLARGPLSSSLLLRREAIARVGPFDESTSRGDWIDWYMRLHDSGARIEMIPEPLTLRRLHEGNNSARGGSAGPQYLGFVKAHLDRVRSAG